MNRNKSRIIFQFIKETDVEEVVKILESHPRSKPLYTERNVSAAMVSIKKIAELENLLRIAFDNDEDTDGIEDLIDKQFIIYENLVSRGFTIGPHEKIEVKLEVESRIKLRKVHKTYVKNANLRYLTILISKSKLSHDAADDDRSAFHQKITKAFEELNEVEWISSMLRIAANSEELNIIFNFIQDSESDLQLLKKSEESSCAKLEDINIIADENNRPTFLGSLAQQLTHFALDLIYHNSSKPYYKDSEAEQIFENILNECESKTSSETSIASVFNCHPRYRHAELISRVPKLLIRYKDDPERLIEVKKTFAQLFGFYEKRILDDFDKEYPYMTARMNVKELNELINVSNQLMSSDVSFKDEELNFEFDSLKISLVHSNYPRLSLRFVYQQLHENYNFETSNIFLKLETLHNERILDLIVKSFKDLTKPMLFIECEDQKAEDILKFLEIFKQKEMNERIVFLHSIDSLEVQDVDKLSINQSWDQLSIKTQENLLETDVKFQGVLMTLNKILPADSEALKAIPLKLLLEQNVKIAEELKFPTIDNYIKRSFLPHNSRRIEETDEYSIELSSDELLAIAEKQKAILFSDDPGMGKSVEFKEIAKRLKSKTSTLWILFVDLKEFVEFYERDGNVTTTFGHNEDIIYYFCNKILKIGEFESKIFQQLYNQNQIVFLLDGFDEISPSFKQFNLKLARAIRTKSENQLWIATRPHLESELEEAISTKAFRLKPLNYEDRSKFMKKMLESKGFTGDVLNQKFIKIEELLSNLRRNSQLSGAVSNPILLRIITEIFEDEVSNLITKANFYSVYKSFIKKIIENFLDKGFHAQVDSATFLTYSTDLMAFHQKRALEVIFVASSDELRESIPICFEGIDELPVEQITRVSFTVSDSSGRLQFVHRTFAEFFITDFFNKNLFGIDVIRSNAVATLFHEAFVEQKNNSGMIGHFFDGVLETLSLRSDTHRFEKIKQIFNEKFSKSEIIYIFHAAVEEGLINTIKALPVHVGDNQQQLWFDDDENVFIIAAEYQGIDFIEALLALAQKDFDQTIVDQMLHGHNKKGETILTAALSNRNSAVFNFFLKLFLSSTASKETFLFNTGNKKVAEGTNLLMHAIRNSKMEEMKKIIEILNENFDKSEVEQMLTSVDSRGSNILSIFAMSTPSKEGMFTILSHFLAEHLTKAQLKELSLQSDSNKMSPVMYAANTEKTNEIEMLLTFLKDSIDEEELFKSLLPADSEPNKNE